MSLTKVTYSMISGAELNVLDFGAVSGSDSTSAIANAIAALPATGGAIYFPKGTYITDAITLPVYPKCVTFFGDGRQVSLLKPRSQNQKLIQSAGIVSGIGGTRFEMRHMGIVPHASGSTGMAIDMRNMSASIFFDVAFVSNNLATFDVGFELFADDTPGAEINCYYNVFKEI